VSQERWEFSADLRVAPARQLTVAITANPLSDPKVSPGLWAVNFLDVTRLINAGSASATSLKDGDLDKILFAISHDLQAPLNSLASHARTLFEGVEPDGLEARLAVKEIGTLTARMQLMLDGMLQVASVRTNEREAEVVSLDAVLQDALENLRSEIDETGATIERHPLPTLVVNRQQMVQVLQNLLANALKFRGNRIPRVRVSAEENGDAVRILVEDNGIGIETKDSDRIFGMFQRLHNEREYPGIGVGLAICQQIIRAHGGEISVESTPGRGSCFIIEFKGAALRSVINRSARNGVLG
jgi:light-regulated signal transduction histidine kinase (bacteriophytochrome)